MSLPKILYLLALILAFLALVSGFVAAAATGAPIMYGLALLLVALAGLIGP